MRRFRILFWRFLDNLCLPGRLGSIARTKYVELGMRPELLAQKARRDSR